MKTAKKIAILVIQKAEPLSEKAQQELQVLKNSLTEIGSQFTEFTTQTLSSLQPQKFGGIVLITDSYELPFNEDLKSLVQEFYNQFNPIGVIGLAALITAETLGHLRPTLTVAEDARVISELKKYGSYYEPCPAEDYITDRDTRVISTPGSSAFGDFSNGISGLAKELVEMA